MNPETSTFPGFLARGGEMGRLIRDFDWQSNPLGDPFTWPSSIQTSVGLCLDSLFPMLIWIGPEFRMIYNDAYLPALGSTKHPNALGQPGAVIWSEIWDTIGPRLNKIMDTGESVWEDNQLLLLARHGYLEETYWTYSYSPIRDESGEIVGIFSAIKETTTEVINDRHLRTLRDMGKQIVDVKNIDEVYAKCRQVIGSNTYDFPFTLFYRLRPDNSGADLFDCTGVDTLLANIPKSLDYAEGHLGSRNFLKCVETKKPVQVHDVQSRLGQLPSGFWNASPEEAILLPITLPGADKPKVIIIAGINPFKKLTTEYASFYELVADQISTEIVKIKSYEEGRLQAMKIAEIHQVNERNFRLMSNSIPQMVWVTDADGNAYFHNDQWTTYTGLSADQLKDSGWQQALHPRDLGHIRSKWQAAYNSRTVFETEYQLRGTDGIYRWFLARAVPIVDEAGNITRWYGTTTNIDEKRKLEEKISESENMLRKLVDHSPSSIVILSGPLLIVEQGNKKYFEVIGMKPEDVIGKSALDLFPNLRVRGLDKIIYQTMETGEPYFRSEYEVDMASYGSNETLYFTFLYQPLKNSEGIVDKVMVVSTDITTYVRLRKNIELSESKYRNLIQGLPAAVYTCDKQGKILLYNQAALELWGTTPDTGPDLIHDTWKAFDKDGNYLPPEKCPVAMVLKGEEAFQTEIIIERPDGSRRNIILHPQPILDEHGQIDGAVNMLLDITEQKKAQVALQESEKKLKLLSESVPQLVWTANNNGEINYFNNRIQEYAKVGNSERGYEWGPMVHPDDYESTAMEWSTAVSNGTFYQKEHRLKMADGTFQWHLSMAYAEKINDGKDNLWFGTATNIDELKISEDKIKESNSRLRLAIESTRMGTWDYNPLTDELELSDRTREIFGFEPMEKVDMIVLYDTIVDADRSHVISSIQYALMLDSDGNLDLEFSINKKRTRKEKVLKLNGKTFFDDKGNAYRFVGTVLDITEQKKFSEELEARIVQRTQELKVANDELMQINRKLEKSNNELESFTYVASHDLQEPLRKILFFTDLIQQNSNNALNGLEKYFNKITVSTRRMSDLITALLQYSTISISRESFTDVDLNTVLQNVREDYEILIEEKRALIMSDQLPVVRGNKLQLFQLMANLVSNALKFSADSPTIRFGYRLKKMHDLENIYHTPYTVFHEISIRDNGIGFEQEYSDQIFVIFQRLHHRNEFPGMGLGLALCKKIIENHQGSIHVKSEPGKGAEFTILLPA